MKKTTLPTAPALPTREALATLDAEVQRRRLAAQQPKPLANVTKAEAPADFSALLERSRARWAAVEARFAPQVQAEPPAVCEAHPDAPARPLDLERTLAASVDADKFAPVFPPCLECAAVARDRRRWELAGFPERVLDATLANFQVPRKELERARDKAARFAVSAPGRGGFLILLGTTGTGKGHLAAGACKKITPRGSAVWMLHAALLTKLRDLYGTGRVESFLEHLAGVDVLILDEFGVSAGGKDEAPVLYQVLAARHDKRRATILTSNEEMPDVKKALGFRLEDRVRECCTVANLEGPSWRTPSPAPVEQ